MEELEVQAISSEPSSEEQTLKQFYIISINFQTWATCDAEYGVSEERLRERAVEELKREPTAFRIQDATNNLPIEKAFRRYLGDYPPSDKGPVLLAELKELIRKETGEEERIDRAKLKVLEYRLKVLADALPRYWISLGKPFIDKNADAVEQALDILDFSRVRYTKIAEELVDAIATFKNIRQIEQKMNERGWTHFQRQTIAELVCQLSNDCENRLRAVVPWHDKDIDALENSKPEF